MKELEPPISGDRLEQQFRALEGAESSADKMLEDLKARMARLEDKSGQDKTD
jgi:hypothetical protein